MKAISVVFFILFISIPSFAGNFPGTPLGQIVSEKWWTPAPTNFTWNQNAWQPTNLSITQTKLYDDTVFRCDVMFDAQTQTSGSVFAALSIDGIMERWQALPGAPAHGATPGEITFGFSSVIGELAAGTHMLEMDVAVQDGSTVVFATTTPAITCYETALPPFQH
jgi:hypothetical protein